MKFCPACGGELKTGAKFCADCGKALTEVKSGGKRRRWMIVIAARVLGLLGLRLYSQYDMEQIEKDEIAKAKLTPIDIGMIQGSVNGVPSGESYDLARFNVPAKTGYDLDMTHDMDGHSDTPPSGGPGAVRK